MTEVFMRIMKFKEKSGLSWNDLAQKADIAVASWMTGIPTSNPTDSELKSLAAVLNTTFNFLKYGK